MEILVGYTGFVGSNLKESHHFDGLYNSKNIKDAYGCNADLLVYSGVPAQKFLANNEPQKDFSIIEGAIENIKKINPKEIVLISTIDVFKNPINVDEDSKIDIDGLQPYGFNRYYLENWVSKNIKNHLIVHLPGLYGKNIKKNFIYDLVNIIPSMLSEEKFKELSLQNNYLEQFYKLQENGFYKCREINLYEKKELKKYFEDLGFSALNFTDSRGIYQFYNLKYLWSHIELARKNHLKKLNLATEPISIAELYKYIKNQTFKNEVSKNVPNYNFKTKYDTLFNGKNGYIFDKKFILEDIQNFVKNKDI